MGRGFVWRCNVLLIAYHSVEDSVGGRLHASHLGECRFFLVNSKFSFCCYVASFVCNLYHFHVVFQFYCRMSIFEKVLCRLRVHAVSEGTLMLFFSLFSNPIERPAFYLPISGRGSRLSHRSCWRELLVQRHSVTSQKTCIFTELSSWLWNLYQKVKHLLRI